MIRFAAYKRQSGLVIFNGYRSEEEYEEYLALVEEYSSHRDFDISMYPVIEKVKYHVRYRSDNEHEVPFASFEEAYDYALKLAEAEGCKPGKYDDYFFPRSAAFWGEHRKFVLVKEVPCRPWWKDRYGYAVGGSSL